jgi:hypothetical protein
VPTTSRTFRIFVSYSHMDRKWFDPNCPFALIPWLENPRGIPEGPDEGAPNK